MISPIFNRRFPEITGKDNLTVFSYSGRVKSPEWRRQLRRADLRQFQIFRHGPVIIYSRLPAGGTYYPICMFPTNSERLIGISDAFSAFVYGYPSSCPRAQCTPQQKRDYSALYPQAWTCIYIQAMPVGTYRVQYPGFPKIVYYTVCRQVYVHFLKPGNLTGCVSEGVKHSATTNKTMGRFRLLAGFKMWGP